MTVSSATSVQGLFSDRVPMVAKEARLAAVAVQKKTQSMARRRRTARCSRGRQARKPQLIAVIVRKMARRAVAVALD
ncbi:hypothetical protein OIF68_23010 [Actinacidiphila glaucinigra]